MLRTRGLITEETASLFGLQWHTCSFDDAMLIDDSPFASSNGSQTVQNILDKGVEGQSFRRI
ncbi:hypothetical protein NPIL_90671, partial [Nephila pilipes]